MGETGPDAEQALLDSFAGGERPHGEAAAVAGNGGVAADVVDVDEQGFPPVEEAVELGVTQVNYTVEGYGDDEYPVLHVFGRTASGEPEHVRVYQFRPYFYTPLAALDHREPESGPVRRQHVTDSRIVDEERLTGLETYGDLPDPGDHDPGELVAHESIRGETLVKVFGQTPRDVGQLRDEFDHYEADILFPNRLLIDKDVTSGVRVPARRLDDGSLKVHHRELRAVDLTVEPRVNTFDIEVDDRSGFPEDGEEPIVCLTSHDSVDDEYVVWLNEDPGIDGPDALDGYDPIEGAIDVTVRRFDDEVALLSAFVDYVRRTDPDVLTGWNFTDFDAPYLLDRIDVLATEENDLDSDRLSRVNEVWRSDWQGPNVKGRVVFDLLYAYKRTQFTELESYRLDAVGETELGVGKERYPGDIGDLWEEDPERLLEYNLRDVELCVELDRKQDIIPFWEEVASFVGCKLEDATTPGDAVDMYILHKVHGQFALPSKGTVDAEEYEGGAVFDPITGVRENVTVLDLKSLYPMCMVTINASPETKVDADAFDSETAFEEHTYRAPNGTHFRKEPDGIIREMVDELLTEREQKKAARNENDPGSDAYEQFDRQQAAVKVIMNCFTPDTDVLTPAGVRSIRDLDVGDEVYSLDPESMQLEVKPVVETHAYPGYRGELVDIQTTKADFRVTPNHRMLVRKNDRNGESWDEYRFVEAGELNANSHYELPHDWAGPSGDALDVVDLTRLAEGDYEVWVRPSIHGRTFTTELGWTPRRVPKADRGETGYVFTAEEFERHREYIEEVSEASYVHAEPGHKWVPRTYDGDDFLDLLAWYVTEGSVYTSDVKQFGEHFRGSSTTVSIAQDAIADGGNGGGDHATIGALLDRMGFDTYVDDRGYQFTSKLLGETLERLCGGTSSEKRIPDLVYGASQRQKRRFLDTLVAGDGDRNVNSWRYTTSSERLRDDVLELCAHVGQTANYGRDSGSWRIYCTENGKNSVRMHRSGSRSTAEEGVYCVTVADNHTLLAGRNGTFQFVGQSLYGVLGWDRFRLYDKEMGAAVTATGREVIEHTKRAVDEAGYEVAYGDTDSVMLDLSGISPDDVADQVTVTDEMRSAHPEMDETELEMLGAAIQKGFELEEQINASYDEFALEQLDAAHHRFQIEFEKLYRRFFQA
ncbi:MAG: DNA polymerase domain-containing protein, partial [Haloarculaceae archaeon]